ncbi:GYF domain-containing protein [Salix suchowensis]|nr:GYF domain-containing protein [Salix suchowensis]
MWRGSSRTALGPVCPLVQTASPSPTQNPPFSPDVPLKRRSGIFFTHDYESPFRYRLTRLFSLLHFTTISMVHSDDTEDHWSDAPETLDDDRPDLDDAVHHEADMIQQHDEDITIRAVAVSVDAVDKIDQSAVSHPSRGASMSTAPPTEPVSDAASIHSLPAVYVTEPDTSPRRPSPILTNRAPPSSPVPPLRLRTVTSRLQLLLSKEGTDIARPLRLSGFFTNLIHRREHAQAPPAPGSVREASTSSPAPRNTSHSNTPSRSSSPPPARPTTPPPHLAPPTLRELGLSLSVITQDLSPSHFSTSRGVPYALVRRVSFKSVVVMEQRGVLVAIAGRRDGVRVYALEEVKKAVEWRMEVEIRRERERQRREQARKSTLGTFEVIIPGPTRDSGDKLRKASLSTPPLGDSVIRGKLARKSSISSTKRPRTNPSTPVTSSDIPELLDRPPPYVHSPEPSVHDTPPRLRPSTSVISLQARSRSSSISNVLAVAPFSRRNTTASQRSRDPDAKPDREESSDDEAINIVAAGSSGSQALDERTSAMNASNSSASASAPLPSGDSSIAPSSPRRGRPANLDLSLARGGNILPPEPSPAPTLLTLRQALSHSPSTRTTRLPQEPEPAKQSRRKRMTRTIASKPSYIGHTFVRDITPGSGANSEQKTALFSTLFTSGRRCYPHSPSSSSLDARLHQSSTSTPSVTPLPETPPVPTSSASSPQISQRSRFIPRVISNALAGRRSGDQPSTEPKHSEAEVLRKASTHPCRRRSSAQVRIRQAAGDEGSFDD